MTSKDLILRALARHQTIAHISRHTKLNSRLCHAVIRGLCKEGKAHISGRQSRPRGGGRINLYALGPQTKEFNSSTSYDFTCPPLEQYVRRMTADTWLPTQIASAS